MSLPLYIGVRPCGHSARNNEIQVKVYASCQPDQVPSSLMFSSRGCKVDQNKEIPRVKIQEEISPGQTTLCRDYTEITCGEENECAHSQDFTFQKRRETGKISFVKGTNRGRKAWYCVLLVDNPETIRKFEEKTQGGLKMYIWEIMEKS